MAVTDYKHGVTWRDIPTSIFAPVTADVGIPVIVGASPIFQSQGPKYVNTPRVYLNYGAATREMGFSRDFASYGISLGIYTYFALFNTGPIVVINVLDSDNPFFHGPPKVDSEYTFRNGVCYFIDKSIQVSSLVITNVAGTVTYNDDPDNPDYTGSWGRDPRGGQEYYYSVYAIPGGRIPMTGDHPVLMSFNTINPGLVNKTHIIGGIDPNTGDTTGLEAIEKVFSLHTIVPGYIITPNYSQDPEVAAVCAAKADIINGCFRCITGVDIDSVAVVNPINVKAWKDANNYTEERQAVCWPRVGLEDSDYWLSVQLGARMQKTDSDNGNIPVETPSNKLLKMNKLLVGPYQRGREISYSKDYGDMLNGQGIMTAINWIGGWKHWGSNMGCYPDRSTDPKDRWITGRRMTDFVGNSLVLTIFQKVDKPGNRRLIDSVVDSTNLWLNSLVGSGNALGARVEFRHDENPDIEIIDGHYLFHVFQFFPIPAEWIEFILELDVAYLSVLFD